MFYDVLDWGREYNNKLSIISYKSVDMMLRNVYTNDIIYKNVGFLQLIDYYDCKETRRLTLTDKIIFKEI